MRISIGDNLPIHPRNPCLADLIRILLNIRISRAGRQRAPLGTIIVRRIKVTHPPLLHHELLAGALGLLHVRLQFALGEVADAVGVNGDHVEGRAREVGVLH